MQRAEEVRGVGFQSNSTRGESATPLTLKTVVSLSPRTKCLAYTADESRKAGDWAWSNLPADSQPTPWALFLTDRSSRFCLLGIDLDHREDVTAADVAEDLTLVRSVLDQLGFPYLVCASGGRDGRHVWLRCDPTSAATVKRLNLALKTVCRTFDQAPMSNPTSGCLRAPGSPHIAGGASTILNLGTGRTSLQSLRHIADNPISPSDVEALADVFDELAKPIREANARHAEAKARQEAEQRAATAARAREDLSDDELAVFSLSNTGLGVRDLAPFAKVLLAHTPTGDASLTAHQIARSYIYAGRDVTDYIRAAIDDKAPGLEHIRTRRIDKRASLRVPRSNPEAHARHLFRRAIRTVPANHRVDAARASFHRRQDVEEIALTAVEIALKGSMWTGPTGSVFHRALASLAAITISRGIRTVTLSSRSWAIHSGLTAPQISQAARALEKAGWIKCVSPAAGPLAAQWQVVDRRGLVSSDPHFPITNVVQAGGEKRREALGAAEKYLDLAPESGRHDCWQLPNLGTTGHAIWMALQVYGTLSEASLAGLLGLDVRTVRKTLPVLALFDLVRGCGAGQYRALSMDRADSHSALLGCSGVQDSRRRRYEFESAMWAVRCAERVWRTSVDKRNPPNEVALLRQHVATDRHVFRSESTFPLMRPVSTQTLCEYAQAWRRRLADRVGLTDAEWDLLEPRSDDSNTAPQPPPPSPTPDILVAA